jgi:nucleoside diphosphate kinase
MERTYVMVKPDGVQRGLVGEILKRFEQRGYQLLALELIHPTKERLEEHVSLPSLLVWFHLIVFINLVPRLEDQGFLPCFG